MSKIFGWMAIFALINACLIGISESEGLKNPQSSGAYTGAALVLLLADVAAVGMIASAIVEKECR